MYNESNYQPAFPTGDNPESNLYSDPGMSIRDYMAASALRGFCSSPENLDRFGSFKSAAGAAYEMADAMLEARNQ